MAPIHLTIMMMMMMMMVVVSGQQSTVEVSTTTTTTTTSNSNDPYMVSTGYNQPLMATKFGVKYDEALEAIFSVALRLEALLSDSGLKTSRNFLVSPLSIAVGVGQLMLGAAGHFQQELYDLLVIDTANVTKSGTVRHSCWKDHAGVPYYTLHEQLGNLVRHLEERGTTDMYMLEAASVLFVQHALNISGTYRDNIKHFYGTDIHDLQFAEKPTESEHIINNWAKNHTHGVIKRMVPGPLPARTSAILANAVYFKGDWEAPFSSQINKNGSFYTSNNSAVNVTFMIGEFENYKYVNSSKLRCEMVVIPYEKRELAMYIIKPYAGDNLEYDINKFTSSLRTKDILELIGEARDRKVFMVLPKMQLSNTISVLEPLKRYYQYKKYVRSMKPTYASVTANNGSKLVEQLEDRIDSFQTMARQPVRDHLKLDLSGISTDPRFDISNIYQQMTLSIHEKGTEAAAITAGIMDYILDSVYFRVDKPFLFFIRHEATGASLFWGTVLDPTENLDQ